VSFRETLEKNKTGFTIAAAVITVIAIGYLFYSSLSSGAPDGGPPDQYYFSTDDGASYFAADMKKVPPFDSGGKVAVRAYVYTCDGGKTNYVAYLERFTDASKKQMEAMIAQGKVTPLELAPVSFSGSLVKLPKSERWIPQSSPAAMQILDAPCPGTKSIENKEPVNP
jgi:hypothetical protein